MTQTDREFKLLCLVLCRMTFLSTQEKFTLIKKLDSLHNLIVQSIEDISLIIGRKSKAAWDGHFVLRQAQKDLYILEKFNISTVLYTDREYPPLLREISDPPFLLFYRGDIKILQNQSVSVVGTRRMTAEAARECVEFSKNACLDGINVISGLAFGIDRKAHEGALMALEGESGINKIGKTAAVLPGGIDSIVPQSNKKLAAKIIENGGCILSEYPPGEGAKSYQFVQRNRIIAGLSSATVVIQAPPASGAMHTAEFALDYNREVVFHKAAFTESSKKISAIIRNQLKMMLDSSAQNNAQKGVIEKKLKKDPELYVQDGAPVIENYADYCRYLLEIPGKRNCTENKDAQLSLFE